MNKKEVNIALNSLKSILPDNKFSNMNFSRSRIITASSVKTIVVSKGDQCSCTGQPGEGD